MVFTHEAGPPVPGVAYHAQADARSAAAMQSFFIELFGSDANANQEIGVEPARLAGHLPLK
jgi:hypothetical protein